MRSMLYLLIVSLVTVVGPIALAPATTANAQTVTDAQTVAHTQTVACTTPVRVAVEIEDPFTTITSDDLAELVGIKPDSFVLEAVDKPSHGDLEWDLTGIRYTPEEDFWSLRSDSFTYRFSTLTTSAPGLQTKVLRSGLLQLVAHLSASTSMRDNFEVSIEHCGWTVDGPRDQVGLTERPAGSGRHWLEVTEGSPVPAYLSLEPEAHPHGHFNWPPECSTNPTHGTTDDCFTMNFAGPPDPKFEGELTIFRAHLVGPDGEITPPLDIRLERYGDNPTRVYATDGNGCTTDSAKLGPHNTTLQLDLWRDHEHGGGAGMMLRLDDQVVGLVRCLSPLLDDLVESELGLVDLATAEGPQLVIDNFAIGDRDPEWTLPAAGWRIDSFECGNLAGWGAAGLWVPRIERAAALRGEAGLEVDLGAIAESSVDYGFLHDTKPADLTTFNLRFRIDPHTASLLSPDLLVLVSGSDSEIALAPEHLRLELSAGPNGVQLRAQEVDDSGVPHSTPWTDLGFSGVDHLVELQWRAASAPEADDGFVRLWIDGAQVGEVVGIDNDTRRIQAYQLGAREVPQSARGTVYLDEVETWN